MEMWQCGLRHPHPHYHWVEADTINHNFRKRIVNSRHPVVIARERVEMNPLFLGPITRPQKGLVRSPNLKTARIVLLTHFYGPSSGSGYTLQVTTRDLKDANGISNSVFVVPKVPAASGAEMTPVWMYTEPVPI